MLDELRELEERYADVLVTIGVHSPKFAHEADPDAVAAAVERYAVHHPVLDDPELRTWDAYAARAWPTLVVIDPRGYVVAQMSGEGHAHGLAVLVEELVAEHADALRRGDGPYVAPPEPTTALRFPGKVIALPGGGVPGRRHRPPPARRAGARPGHGAPADRHGRARAGRRARRRGSTSRWGLLLLPDGDVLVSPTPSTTRCAGSGWPTARSPRWRAPARQLRDRVAPGATAAELSSPWDVAWWDGRVVVAMAGIHQLWTFDPATGATAAWAGTTNEGLRDGPPAEACFAQPSGLAAGRRVLWVADAETSALREVRPALVATAVGQGLFDFGHRDGPADEALLQHPLGVAVLPDGSVAVADTYNGAVRRYDPATRDGHARWPPTWPSRATSWSTATRWWSSSRRRTGWSGCRSRRRSTLRRGGGTRSRCAGATDVAPGHLALRVAFVPPTGQHLDTRFGDPTAAHGGGVPAGAARAGAGTAPGLSRELVPRRRARGGAVGQRRGGRVRRGRRGVRRLPPLPAGLGHPGAPRRRARPPSWCWICAPV